MLIDSKSGAGRRPPAVYAIAAGLPFVDALAAGLRERMGETPDALTEAAIFLPNRRACRALALAFVRQTRGRPLLLPRMTPLGDIDEDDFAFAEADALAADPTGIPPAVSPLRRQLLLTRQVARLPGIGASPAQAARLAAELARLFDQVHTEGLDLAGLHGLVPDELAGHWQITLGFLQPLAAWWRATLEAEGAIDPADRRNRLLAARAALWRAAPPETPVIAAGSTGSVPASAELLRVIASLPNGAVLLPGLDREADDATWAALSVEPGEPEFPLAHTHPQFGLARLLACLGVSRRDVRPWPSPGVHSTTHDRIRVLNRALAPAGSGDGLRAAALPAGALDGVTVIDAATPEEEARTIALILRQTLERPAATAALVTPDRTLARRVAAEVERWGIALDDSGGQPLAQTPPAAFLRLVAGMIAEDLAPVPLLAALKHPLAAGGEAPGTFRRRVHQLERCALRGLRPAPGAAGLRQALAEGREGDRRGVLPLLDALEQAIAPCVALREQERASLPALTEAHVMAAQALAASHDRAGAARLWAGDAGEALASFVADLARTAPEDHLIPADDFPELLDVLMEGRVVRPRWGRHPRLAIWGPLEARLQRADVMILGSLNEETWPPKAQPSPWMSRPMMQAFGLPLPERRIGLSAHDFCQAFGAPEVWLTRAARKDGTPTVPCRWLLRLKTLLHGDPWLAESDACARRLLDWQRQLDAPAQPPAPMRPPEPRPPLEARPRRLSVTQVETWLRNPYAVYARHILGLKELDPLDVDPESAEFGTLVHAALGRFVDECRPDEAGSDLPADALDRLLELGREQFAGLMERPGVRSFWWPRFERIARWFVAQERERRPALTASAAEVTGSLAIAAPAGPFELTARADRIDRLSDGTLAIIDYKTGQLPKPAEVEDGSAPQLPLEAAIAEAGGFRGFDAEPVSALEYWHLKGDDAGGSCRGAAKTLDGLADRSLSALRDLIAVFDDPATPYAPVPRPHLKPSFDAYEHLARCREWAAGEEGGS